MEIKYKRQYNESYMVLEVNEESLGYEEKMIEEKLPSVKAYAVKFDESGKATGAVNEFELSVGDLTDDERKIILAGCLINFYRG